MSPARITGAWCMRCNHGPALPASPWGYCGLCDMFQRAFRRPDPEIGRLELSLKAHELWCKAKQDGTV